MDFTKAQRVFEDYLDNIMGYIEKKRVPISTPCGGMKYIPPNEDLMRAIEEHCDIHETFADDFRRQIMAFVGTMSLKGKLINWTSNPQMKKAILGYLAESDPGILETQEPTPKYRRVTDPWEPAW